MCIHIYIYTYTYTHRIRLRWGENAPTTPEAPAPTKQL